MLMNIAFSAGDLIAIDGICLDRLPKQRSALREPGVSCDLPPQRGGLGSLSGGAVRIAAETMSGVRT
jgi:hypothetical protein